MSSIYIEEDRGFKSHLGLGFFRVYVSPRILVDVVLTNCGGKSHKFN